MNVYLYTCRQGRPLSDCNSCLSCCNSSLTSAGFLAQRAAPATENLDVLAGNSNALGLETVSCVNQSACVFRFCLSFPSQPAVNG